METWSCPCLSKAFESQRFTELDLAVGLSFWSDLAGCSLHTPALTRSGKALRNQMGMTAMFSYLNRRAVPAEEMWEVVARLRIFPNPFDLNTGPFSKVANLGHFSVGFRAAFGGGNHGLSVGPCFNARSCCPPILCACRS